MKLHKVIGLTICLLIGLILSSGPASGRVYIDINQPFVRKIPLAAPDFVPLKSGGSAPVSISQGLPQMLSHNLDLTGLFIVLDKRTFLEVNKKAGITEGKINFKDWLMIGSELLIKGAYDITGNNLTLELRLFDVFEGRMLLGKRYTSVLKDGQAMITRFINEIMLILTGERGVFGSAIAFVNKQDQNKNIYMVKFGQKDTIKITNNRSLNLSPAFSHDGNELAYISYKTRKPELYVRRLSDGRERKVSSPKGLYISPQFTPSGAILVSISQSNYSNIYLLDGIGRIKRQLTRLWGINISPTISPDGKRFAFVSDRAGTPQIYTASMTGGDVSRVTFEGEYNTDPEWSPRADRLVYVGAHGGRFNIYTIKSDGTDRQQLTSEEADDTNPCWSPNGRLIVFTSTRLGRSMIFTMTANGERQRPLALSLPGEQSSPTWSPVILD
ncbi:MAG: PD40 domain-containing protein [Deltaproteobacteria bacterium]|nr:PD40 domain-containing protein [Deltaproteobacteria bacterium]MBW2053076.1 PD40 domain-containing protein [Deltaproteobacteria bacterium]MBW2141624.1 PD40 domain-containing protein [Deltaproteobacteria bacterium]MBW2321902.1 PD40 domain-containing protein [Deltaproteobacteria bacterium]